MWPFGGSKKAASTDAESTNAAETAPSKDSAAGSAEAIFRDDPADESAKPEKGNILGFDAAALERAAKAAKELNDLPFAQEAINIAKEKEQRRRQQAMAEMEKYKANQKAMEVEGVRMQEQERRKTLQQDHNLKKEEAYLQDQLARKRHGDQLQSQRAMREQQMKREEEFQLRVEGMKRQTAEYEAKLRKDAEIARAQAEGEARTVQERKNWDLHLQRSKMEAMEFRTTILESVKEAGAIMGNGLTNFLQDKEKMATTAGLLTLIAAGFYGAKVSTGVAGRFVEARLGKPPLVRETSRRSPLAAITSPFQTARAMIKKAGNPLDGVVVETKLADRLNTLAVSTKTTKKNGAPYRNALLYGPPGTGKTLFARQLAQASNMDYAILTGGDISPLGRNGVTEIHKLFDWANTSRKGLLIFVDEADAFLRKRMGGGEMTEDLRNSLNAFLYRTGTESTNFMILFSTNQPDLLDFAVVDRTDEVIKFDLPGDKERLAMLKLYFDKYVVNAHQTAEKGMFNKPEQIKVIDIDDKMLESLAKRIKGFSGREIAKLAIGWQATAYASPECSLTPERFQTVADNAIEQHMQKEKWSTENTNY